MHDGTKICSTCRVEKPVSSFGKHSRMPDGLRGQCRACISAYKRRPGSQALARGYAKAARRRDPETAKAKDKRDNDRRGLERARMRAAKRAAWLAEPAPVAMTCTVCAATKPFEDFTADKRTRFGRSRLCKPCASRLTGEYYRSSEERRQAAITKAAAWLKVHPEVGRATLLRRRARLRGATVGRFGPREIDQRMAMFGHRCWICRGPYEQVDHVKPVSKGGAHMLCNLRPICGSCNLRKSARWPLHKIPMLTANAAVGPPVPARVHLTRRNVSVIAPATDEN